MELWTKGPTLKQPFPFPPFFLSSIKLYPHAHTDSDGGGGGRFAGISIEDEKDACVIGWLFPRRFVFPRRGIHTAHRFGFKVILYPYSVSVDSEAVD